MQRLSLIVILILLAGCPGFGIFSGVGETEVTTKKGTKVTETTDLEVCEKTVITEFKNGTKIRRTFPMEPELCKAE